MPNIVALTLEVDGPRNAVLRVNIEGDGSGDEADLGLVVVDELVGSPDTVRLDRMWGYLDGFSARLEWDADTDVPITKLPEGMEFDYDWSKQGGLTNTKGPGYTGDLTITTDGLGVGEAGTIWLHCVKQGRAR